MNVSLDNYKPVLPKVKAAIAEADFVAIDCELTGLQLAEHQLSLLDNPQHRYGKLRKAAQAYRVIQLGADAEAQSKVHAEETVYVARPFNFYVFPREHGELGRRDSNFTVNTGSMAFLAGQGFDFNQLIYKGIPHWNNRQEAAAMERTAGNRQKADIPEDDQNRDYIKETIEAIDTWLQQSSERTMTVAASNGYYRRLVYQIVRNKYNGFLVAQGKDMAVEVKRLTVEERETVAKHAGNVSARAALIDVDNVSDVVRAIVKARKPLVGHNCLTDICHIMQHFWDDLPESVETWKQTIRELWDRVIDTKYLAHHHTHLSTIGNTALGSLVATTSVAPFKNVCAKIVFADGFDRYIGASDQYLHEAGYDAYCTGAILLRMACFAPHVSQQSIMDILDENSILRCTNKLYLMRSELRYLDLAENEQVPSISDPTFIVSGVPRHLRTDDLRRMLVSLGAADVRWVDEARCRITLRNADAVS
ncbi:ribonuclease H-like domain-containing protein, partial [Thamnocephalis sphaerospora]